MLLYVPSALLSYTTLTQIVTGIFCIDGLNRFLMIALVTLKPSDMKHELHVATQ